jgi:hypothetical protein
LELSQCRENIEQGNEDWDEEDPFNELDDTDLESEEEFTENPEKVVNRGRGRGTKGRGRGRSPVSEESAQGNNVWGKSNF